MLEPRRELLLLISFIVIIRAMGFLAGNSMKTRFEFEEVWMKLLFLPPMTIRAVILHRATVLVGSYYLFSVPILAQLVGITED